MPPRAMVRGAFCVPRLASGLVRCGGRRPGDAATPSRSTPPPMHVAYGLDGEFQPHSLARLRLDRPEVIDYVGPVDLAPPCPSRRKGREPLAPMTGIGAGRENGRGPVIAARDDRASRAK